MQRRVLVVVACVALAGAAACDKKTTRRAEPSSKGTSAQTHIGRDASSMGERPVDASGHAPGQLVSREVVARVAERGMTEQWFGMYLHHKKVGYARILARPETWEGQTVVTFVTEGRLRASGSEVDIVEERSYRVRPPYRLVAVREVASSSDGKVERIYRADGSSMRVRQLVDDQPGEERTIAASRDTLHTVLDQMAVEPGEVSVGQSAELAEFDTDSEADKMVSVRVAELSVQRISGVDTQVAVLASRDEGETSVTETVVASGAAVLRATTGDNLHLRREERDTARSNVVGFDIMADAVAIDQPLGDPAKLEELDLIVTVPKTFRLRDAPNQELTRLPDGSLAVSLRSRPGLPVLPGERTQALRATSSFDATDPAIEQLARTIAADQQDRQAVVAALVEWVYRNLDKDLTTNLSTASQVLTERGGDCTEHTLLFVALARAVGVPAREVSGLVYMGDDAQRFGWHAWAEVDIDGRWVQVDPSWGETIANATHLTLGTGDQSDWLATLGTLTLRVAPGSN